MNNARALRRERSRSAISVPLTSAIMCFAVIVLGFGLFTFSGDLFNSQTEIDYNDAAKQLLKDIEKANASVCNGDQDDQDDDDDNDDDDDDDNDDDNDDGLPCQ